MAIDKVISPEGEEFIVEEESTKRILTQGLPLILSDSRVKTLSVKEGEYFLVTDMEGNISPESFSGLGFFYQDTRFLNNLNLTINGKNPISLSSSAERDYMAYVELTNPDLENKINKKVIPQESINIRRFRLINEGLYERIRVKNYNNFSVKIKLKLILSSDFADIFEIRGVKRISRGKILCPKKIDDDIILAYQGEDEVFRQTRISVLKKPDKVQIIRNEAHIYYNLEIKDHGRIVLNFFFDPIIGIRKKEPRTFNHALSLLRNSYNEWEKDCTKIFTDNELFNSVIQRGIKDIRALLTKTKHGTIFSAGIPWFVAPFGRDSILTCIQTLQLMPKPTKETIKMLVKHQGREVDGWRDEEPGKIFHEIRQGELANLRQIPHTPYYGTVDATPLFLVLLTEYFNWTNDVTLIREIMPQIERALDWIDNFGDIDGDLFVEYERKSKRGLINQGWKDSYNSIMHTDGTLAKSPIALVEVQAYVYYAKKRIAQLFSYLNQTDKAKRLMIEAEALKRKFNKDFWINNEDFLALALDGEKDQVKTISSNPGQVLWTGILEKEKAKKVIKRLIEPEMFSGWGIRTISKSSSSYNPMSYHNGSIWPHDNSIIIRGMKRYGELDAMDVVMTGIFDAAIHHAYFRLPELFCGFTRRGNNWPVSYPVACKPQAWAAGSIFMLLQSMLGITPKAPDNTLLINNPTLPAWLNYVEISNLQIGKSRLSIAFNREENVTGFTVKKKEGKLKIIMEE